MASRKDGTGELSRGKWPLVFMGLLCGLLIVGGVVLSVRLGDAKAQPLTLGDVDDATIVEVRNQHGATVLSGGFISRVDRLGNTEKDAALTGRDGENSASELVN